MNNIDTTLYDGLSSEEKGIALTESAGNGNLEEVKALIKSGANTLNEALMSASFNGNLEIEKLLIEAGAKWNSYCL